MSLRAAPLLRIPRCCCVRDDCALPASVAARLLAASTVRTSVSSCSTRVRTASQNGARPRLLLPAMDRFGEVVANDLARNLEPGRNHPGCFRCGHPTVGGQHGKALSRPWRNRGRARNAGTRVPSLLRKIVEAPGVPPVRASLLYEECAERIGGAGNGALSG